MAHNFESGMVVRQQAWHGLATVLPDHPNVADAIVRAGLDWTVLEREVQTKEFLSETGIEASQDLKGHKALIRDRDRSFLGLVSSTYKVLQNKDLLGWMQPMVDDGTLRIDTAGSLQEGRKVWVQAIYADTIEVKDGDTIVPRLLAATGHDGKISVRFINTPIRVVCDNTASAAGVVEDGDGSIEASKGLSIAHTGDLQAKIVAARNAIVVMNKELHLTIDAYRKMARLPVTEEYVRRLAKEVFDADFIKASDLIAKFRQREEHGDVSIREKTRLAIAQLETMLGNEGRVEKAVIDSFHNGPGSNLAGETAWGAFNAVTDYLDHKAPGGQDRRMTSSWFGEGSRKRRKAFELITASM